MLLPCEYHYIYKNGNYIYLTYYRHFNFHLNVMSQTWPSVVILHLKQIQYITSSMSKNPMGLKVPRP